MPLLEVRDVVEHPRRHRDVEAPVGVRQLLDVDDARPRRRARGRARPCAARGRWRRPRRRSPRASHSASSPQPHPTSSTRFGLDRRDRGDEWVAASTRRVAAGVRRRAAAKPCLVGVLARDERRIVESHHALSATNTVWCVRAETGCVNSGTFAATCARVMSAGDEPPHRLGGRKDDDAARLARLDVREVPRQLLSPVRRSRTSACAAAARRGTPRGRSGSRRRASRRRACRPAGAPARTRRSPDRDCDTW